MKGNHKSKSWLQLYVDAMTERDPYKRLTLVRELRQLPKEKEPDESLDSVLEENSGNIWNRETHLPKARKPEKTLRRKLRSGA